jgi:porin
MEKQMLILACSTPLALGAIYMATDGELPSVPSPLSASAVTMAGRNGAADRVIVPTKAPSVVSPAPRKPVVRSQVAASAARTRVIAAPIGSVVRSITTDTILAAFNLQVPPAVEIAALEPGTGLDPGSDLHASASSDTGPAVVIMPDPVAAAVPTPPVVTSGEAVASPDLRFAPTTRPDTPEPQKPPEATTQNTDTNKPFLEWQRATDDWGGFRPKLDDKGISIQSSLTMDAFKGFSGGLDTSGSAVRELFNLNVTVDSEKLLNYKGGTFFANFQIQGGRNGQEVTGSAMGVSNIDADGRVELAELWYEQSLLDDKFAIRFGKIDAAAQFAHSKNCDEFVNSVSATSPTIAFMPAYPDGATGLELIANPTDNLYAAAGVFDGALRRGESTGEMGPHTLHLNDLFMIAEAGVIWGKKELEGRVVVGGWYHTERFDRFDGTSQNGTGGLYVVVDQTLWRAEPGNADSTRGISAFAVYGHSDPDLFDFEHFVGTGVVWTGPWSTRPDDVLGLAVNWARFSGEPGALSGNETQIEGFYKFKLTPWLSIKPDVMYIANPGGDTGASDCLFAGLRVVADF